MKSFSLLFIAFLGAALAGQALGQFQPQCWDVRRSLCGSGSGSRSCNCQNKDAIRRACGYFSYKIPGLYCNRRLDAVESDEIDEGRALGKVNYGCYFAQDKYCGHCGGSNDCRMKCNQRHESELRKACGFRRLR